MSYPWNIEEKQNAKNMVESIEYRENNEIEMGHVDRRIDER